MGAVRGGRGWVGRAPPGAGGVRQPARVAGAGEGGLAKLAHAGGRPTRSASTAGGRCSAPPLGRAWVRSPRCVPETHALPLTPPLTPHPSPQVPQQVRCEAAGRLLQRQGLLARRPRGEWVWGVGWGWAGGGLDGGGAGHPRRRGPRVEWRSQAEGTRSTHPAALPACGGSALGGSQPAAVLLAQLAIVRRLVWRPCYSFRPPPPTLPRTPDAGGGRLRESGVAQGGWVGGG